MGNKNAFRIDQVLMGGQGEDAPEFARVSVAAESFVSALKASTFVMAPHVAAGLHVEILRVGSWCERCRCYHDVGKVIEKLGQVVSGQVELTHLNVPLDAPKGCN